MIEAILIALVAIATRGECMDADHYPHAEPDATYVIVGKTCVIPTAPELPAHTLCRMAQDLADPTGAGNGIACEATK